MKIFQGLRWYVVQTHAHCEAKAAMHLNRQGFQYYLPRYLKRRSHARRVDLVAAPLFPRYLFVAFDMATQPWLAIRSTLGVVCLVGKDDEPTPVSDAVVDEIKKREQENGFVRVETKSRFEAGDRVRLLHGPFTLCSGFFEHMSDDDRVAVLLELLGRQVRIVVDPARVAAV